MDKQEFVTTITSGKPDYAIYDIGRLGKKGFTQISRLPFAIRVLVENLLRKIDGDIVTGKNLIRIARWRKQYAAPGYSASILPACRPS